MSDSSLPGGPRTRFTDASRQQAEPYRALDGLAIVSLIFGILSVPSLLYAGFLVFALLGILSGLAALRRIAANAPETAGRPVAMIGLLLSVLLACTTVTRNTTMEFLLRREARQFGAIWLDLLRQDKPLVAFALQDHPVVRNIIDDTLWDLLLTNEPAYENFDEFVNAPGIRTILALGDLAEVRYFDTQSQDNDSVLQFFAVTYDDAGTKKSFFVKLVLERVPSKTTHLADWFVDGYEFGTPPNISGSKAEG